MVRSGGGSVDSISLPDILRRDTDTGLGDVLMTELDRARALLAEHPVVFLSVGLAEGARRVGLSTARPLLAGVNPRATFRALLEQRLPVYREVATVEIDTDDAGPDEVVERVVAALDA